MTWFRSGATRAVPWRVRFVVLVLITTACGRLSFDPVEDGDVNVGFDRDVSQVDETSGTVAIPVRLSAATLREVTVAFEAASGTATSGTDFTGASTGTLTFAPGETEQAVVLTIADDGVSEPDEMFDITLSAPSGALLATATHTITISAEALPRVNFKTEGSEAGESESTTIAVVLDVPSAVEISVDYELEADDNFTLRSGTIVFPPGETRVELALGAVQDVLDEEDLGVVVSLRDPVNAVIGAVGQHTHIIIDDDPLPVMSFTAPLAFNVAESGTVTYIVQLSAPSGREVRAHFARGDGVAEADVGLETGTLVFAPGITSLQFTATIVADTLDELDQPFDVVLFGAVNATFANGELTAQTLTIIDDDDPPTVGIGGAVTTSESIADTGLVVTLSSASGRVVTVPFVLIPGGTTATSADFTLAVGPLVFPPGVTARVIRIDLVNDGLDEPDEAIQIGLGTPTNAILGISTQNTLTISDDDNAPLVQFDPGEIDTAGAEGNDLVSAISYTVVLSAPSARTITLDIDVGLSTATSGTDFSLNSVSITFDPGETTKQFQLGIGGDAQLESDETVVMSLANIVNAQLGAIGTRTHTIQNDDGGS